jgi:DNA-directed RNA polymerase specialized sigma24 family protein
VFFHKFYNLRTAKAGKKTTKKKAAKKDDDDSDADDDDDGDDDDETLAGLESSDEEDVDKFLEEAERMGGEGVVGEHVGDYDYDDLAATMGLEEEKEGGGENQE